MQLLYFEQIFSLIPNANKCNKECLFYKKKYVVDECWKLGHNIFSHFYFTYFFALLVFKLHCVNSANRQSVTICDNTIPYKIPQTVADKIYNKFQEILKNL